MLYGWKENSMLTNCLAKCAHLTITVSQIERDIGRKSSFSHSPLAFDAPVKGFPTSRRNIATPFGMEKLEWLGYPTVKKFLRYLYSFFAQLTNVTDRRTPGDGVYTAFMHMHRAVIIQNLPILLLLTTRKCTFWTRIRAKNKFVIVSTGSMLT